MRGADMMAARDWLTGVTDKGGKPPADIAPTDVKGLVAAIDAQKYGPMVVRWWSATRDRPSRAAT
jgi:hypothetical protein